MLGLNMLTGFNGQISLGHGAFMGIGAYTGGDPRARPGHVVPADHRSWRSSCAVVVGALIGIPALRLPGTSLALITLAMALAFPQILKKFDSVTGGVQGINTPPDRQWNSPWPDSLSNDQYRYLFCITVAILLFWAGLEHRPRSLGPGDDVGARQPGLGRVDGRQPALDEGHHVRHQRRLRRRRRRPAVHDLRLHQPRPVVAGPVGQPAHRHRRRRPRHRRRRRARRDLRAVPAVLLERDLAGGARPSSTASSSSSS